MKILGIDYGRKRIGGVFSAKDGSLTAHFEHTIAITKKGNTVLTK